jgi:hypothetical protein
VGSGADNVGREHALESMIVGSCALLVIRVHRSKIATTEARVANSKLLVNHWRNELSSRDPLGHQLAFTKSAQEPYCEQTSHSILS